MINIKLITVATSISSQSGLAGLCVKGQKSGSMSRSRSPAKVNYYCKHN